MKKVIVVLSLLLPVTFITSTQAMNITNQAIDTAKLVNIASADIIKAIPIKIAAGTAAALAAGLTGYNIYKVLKEKNPDYFTKSCITLPLGFLTYQLGKLSVLMYQSVHIDIKSYNALQEANNVLVNIVINGFQ